MRDFTRCPNGDPGQGQAHDFCGYQPGERDPNQTPLMFCERCGEVRALALPPMEARVATNSVPIDEWDPRIPNRG